MPPFELQSFGYTVDPFGDDQIWTMQQPIGGNNLRKLIQYPQAWVRSIPVEPDKPGDPVTYPKVDIPSPFVINVHVRTPGIPPDHMFIQGIGGTNVINLYLPEVITDASEQDSPPPDGAPVVGAIDALLVLDRDPDAPSSEDLKGKVFVHYPIFSPKDAFDPAEPERRAYSIAEFHLNLARNYDITKVGEAKFELATKTAKWRDGNKLVKYTGNAADIPATRYWTHKVTQAAISSENNASREACEILVAQYEAGLITWEEAYTKPYAGP
jgi:hypothetical protein